LGDMEKLQLYSDRFTEKLRQLAEIDSVVDIGRARVQLEILLKLGENDEGLTSREIAEKTGYRRKTVLDALRKLIGKGLVTHEDDVYKLTSEGINLYRGLLEVLDIPTQHLKYAPTHKMQPLEFARDIATYDFLNDAIIALGAAKNNELPLTILSEIAGISPQRMEDYLEKFTKGRVKLFKRYIKKPWLSRLLGRGRGVVYYRLTSEGLKAYYRLPHYLKMKHNTAAKILQYIARSGHPKLVLKRLALIMAIGSSIAMSLAIFLKNTGSVLILGAWSLLVSFIALLIELAY